MEYAPVPTVAALPQPFPPSFPTSPQAVDLSPLEFVIAIVAVITIPALIYAFFFAIKCPNFRRRSRRSFYDGSDPPGGAEPDGASSGVKFRKEAEADVGSECPVCLSAFAEGEEIKQLSACKHAFHAACVDPWLSSHSNCPICRASTGVKRPSAAPNSSAAGRGRDASSLV